MRAFAFAPAALVAALVVAACGSVAEPTGSDPIIGGGSLDPAPTGGRDSGTRPGTSSGGEPDVEPESCARAFVAVDSAALTVCGDGKGHCYDKDKTPKVGTLTECNATQWCVPNAVLASAGNPLPSCDSGYGAGACVSPLVKEVKDNEANLTHNGCDADSFCVPCVHPTTQRSNPACKAIGVYDNACADSNDGGVIEYEPPVDAGPIELASCCTYPNGLNNGTDYSGGRCVPTAALTPAQQQANFPQNTCVESFTCAPNALVNGQNLPGCYWDEGFFGDDGYGVCVDACFVPPDKYEDLQYIYEGGCGGSEFCVPCRELPAGTPGCF